MCPFVGKEVRLFLKMKIYRKGQKIKSVFKPFTQGSPRKIEKFILLPDASTSDFSDIV